jgi:hypothetical protein
MFCALSTYGATPNYQKEYINSLEKRAERIIRGNFNVPSSEKLKRDRICCNVQKCLYGEVCDTFSNYFELKNTRVNTRNNGSMVQVPKTKLEVARASFYFQGATLFNGLPKEIRLEKYH